MFRVRFAVFALFLVLLLAGCGRSRVGGIEGALLNTPALALEGLQAHSLYYNGPARSWLLEERPELVPVEERAADAEKARSQAQAVQNPKLFRQLDRQYRFDALLLVGDPSQYRPLLEHLLEAQDWKLAYLDHTSLIFRRNPPAEWAPAQLAAVRARLAGLPDTQEALFLAQVSEKLVAVRQLPTAKGLLQEAEKASGKTAAVPAAWAQYYMALGDWTHALASADRALKVDGENLAALAAKAQSLYATKHFEEAFGFSRLLIAKLPDDPGLLFYHAKIAHQARHFQEEARVLEKLIAQAEANSWPDGGYRVYLGQAYAADGNAEAALAALARAIADPDLPPEQRAFAVETEGLIRRKTGAK